MPLLVPETVTRWSSHLRRAVDVSASPSAAGFFTLDSEIQVSSFAFGFRLEPKAHGFTRTPEL